jgi:hypothetical protein
MQKVQTKNKYNNWILAHSTKKKKKKYTCIFRYITCNKHVGLIVGNIYMKNESYNLGCGVAILNMFLQIQLVVFTFMWRCIVTNFFIIKPNRCTNFPHLLRHETTCFGYFLCPLTGVYSLYNQQWYTSYRFVDSFRAGPVPSWSCSKVVWHIPLLIVQWINSWWCTDELSETCRVSYQNKFVKLVHLVGFITKKFVTMQHGHTNVKTVKFI